MFVLGFPDYAAQAQALAQALGCPYKEIALHRFPDGESLVRLPAKLPREVVFCRSLHQPNDKLIELMLAADTAREQGAHRLTLVAPYLCYMRQDMAFQPGEAVSQRHVGRFLAGLFDSVVTVDAHLHRIAHLEEAIPATRAVSLNSGPLLTRQIEQRLTNPVLIGPDGESEQWVQAIAAPRGWDYGVAHKKRLDDRTVDITLPEVEIGNRPVVFVDDMVSTGHTIAAAAELVRQRHGNDIFCAVTHALFMEKAEIILREAGIEQIWSTDSIPHPTNTIPLAELLATALR